MFGEGEDGHVEGDGVTDYGVKGVDGVAGAELAGMRVVGVGHVGDV